MPIPKRSPCTVTAVSSLEPLCLPVPFPALIRDPSVALLLPSRRLPFSLFVYFCTFNRDLLPQLANSQLNFVSLKGNHSLSQKLDSPSDQNSSCSVFKFISSRVADRCGGLQPITSLPYGRFGVAGFNQSDSPLTASRNPTNHNAA